MMKIIPLKDIQKRTLNTPLNFPVSLLPISEKKARKILKALGTEKSAGVYMMAPKLVKLASNYLDRPLLQSINNSIKIGCFLIMQRLLQSLP